MNVLSNVIKIIRNEIFFRRRCENCWKWMTLECSKLNYGAVEPLGLCHDWEKKE